LDQQTRNIRWSSWKHGTFRQNKKLAEIFFSRWWLGHTLAALSKKAVLVADATRGAVTRRARRFALDEGLLMNKQEIFAAIKQNILEVLPDVDEGRVVPETSMRDLGANSIDRADILIMTMESLRLKFPLAELGSVKNLQGLVDFLHGKWIAQNAG
jgi:polyketide biosynthesis acyl carrier protein